MILEMGAEAPDFSLPDVVSGGTVGRADFVGSPLLVMFICNHCPFVKHLRAGLASFSQDYRDRPLAVVAISSNDVEAYPDDSPEKMKEEAAEAGYAFPYLFDESQAVAKAYKVYCTPDFLLFDKDHKLVYHGQFDGSRPTNDVPVSGEDLRGAVDALLAGQAQAENPPMSVGCGIKWKPGNEPG